MRVRVPLAVLAIAFTAQMIVAQQPTASQQPTKVEKKVGPPPLEGYGHPVEETDEKAPKDAKAKSTEKWKRFRFDEVGISVELPEKPGAVPIDDWTEEDEKSYTGWANYEGDGDHIAYDIVVYKQAPGQETTLEEDADSNRETMADAEDIEEKRTPAFVGGKDALRVDIGYKDTDEKKTAKMITLHFKRNGMTVFIRSFFWEDEDGAAKDTERMLGSVKFTKPK